MNYSALMVCDSVRCCVVSWVLWTAPAEEVQRHFLSPSPPLVKYRFKSQTANS